MDLRVNTKSSNVISRFSQSYLLAWSLVSNDMYVCYGYYWNTFTISKSSFVFIKSQATHNIMTFVLFFPKKIKVYKVSPLAKLFYTLIRLVNYENILKTGFYMFVDLIGLGYRMIKITEKLFFFELGWASGVYFFVPDGVKVVVSQKKKKLLIFSFNVHSALNAISSLVLLRGMSPYRIGGFMPYKNIIRLRTGKQR